jgi:hypothetical protein
LRETVFPIEIFSRQARQARQAMSPLSSSHFPFENPPAYASIARVKTSFLPVSIALLILASTRVFAEPASTDLILSEDFESVPVGGIPKGFTKTGALGVAEDSAHSGRKSLRIEPAVKGARVITLTGEKMAAIGGTHWGRLYYKVKLPSPLPVVPEGKTTAGIHTTLVSGKATSPLANDHIDVRLMGTSTNMTGAFKYLFNVQPPNPRKEFGPSAKTLSQYTDQWTLAEWFVDHDTQTYQFFINGQEITDIALHKGAGQFEGAEIPPVFENLSFGWNNYQPASGEGFTVWIDDLALGKKRIGPTSATSAAAARK